MGKVSESLIDSMHPHLFLLNVGLTPEEYSSSYTIPSLHKAELANHIITHCTHEQILSIISDLATLEFQTETRDPIRTGQRLIGQIILAYIKHLELENFTEFYNKEVKINHKSFSTYPIPQKIKEIWACVSLAASNTLSGNDFSSFQQNGLRIMPVFYYQHLLHQDATLEQLRNLPVLTKDQAVVEAFNQQLDIGRTNVPEQNHPNPSNKLRDIKQHILATHWVLGGFWIFEGGLDYNGKRVPHRIKAILDIIDRLDASQVDPQRAYQQIVEKAKEAIDHPRSGQAPSTTQFYRNLFLHDVLLDNFVFRKDEAIYSQGLEH